jgi:hypothetical protein
VHSDASFGMVASSMEGGIDPADAVAPGVIDQLGVDRLQSCVSETEDIAPRWHPDR